MPFLKDLRRRSKASFATNDSLNGSEDSGGAGPNHVESPSSSTLSSATGYSRPPPPLPRSTSHNSVSQLSDSSSTSNRPASTLIENKRKSTNTVYTPSMTTAPKVPTSLYAPRILSINENTWVNHKVLLIYGQVGPDERPLDGTVTVYHHLDHFPPTTWQVTQTHFKALVHLCPGPNDVRFDFSSARLVGTNAPNALHTSRIRINYLPLNNTPPLHLVILLGKDSPATFDSPPEKKGREGNDLETAIRKYRMAAHLWSAFTAEQMYRNGFGRRSFRFEEEYQGATLSSRDRDSREMRNEAKVHVIRSSRTVAEIRDPNVAQQNRAATRKNDLHAWATTAVHEHFKPKTHQTVHAAVLILDSHWDPQAKLITGHAALGAGSGDVRVGIFGSQALHTYPSTIEEVVPALTDCTKMDTNHVAADGGDDSGQWWQAACIGFGAHLHEVGHALGCPHQRSGMMAHDYWTLNRTFITAESFSTRTKQPGLRPCLPSSEPGWHRLDTLRFATHPCFQMPFDTPMHPEQDVQLWALDQDHFIITAKTGISFIELYSEGQDLCDSWIEYMGRDGSDPPPKQLTLSESELRSHLPSDRRSKKLRMVAFSCGGDNYDVKDVSKAVSKVKLSNGNAAYLGRMYGASAMAGHQLQQLLMATAANPRQLLVAVKVYHDFAVNGIELVYETGMTELFGKQKGDGKPKELLIDVRRGETLAGFYIRAGYWIDGIAVIMSTGRRSEVYGNSKGGIGYTLIPPRGYRLAGLYGTFAERIDGIGIVITR